MTIPPNPDNQIEATVVRESIQFQRKSFYSQSNPWTKTYLTSLQNCQKLFRTQQRHLHKFVQVSLLFAACLFLLCSLLNWYIRSIALCNNDIYQHYDTLCHESRNRSPNCHQHSNQEKSSIQQTTFSSQSNLR